MMAFPLILLLAFSSFPKSAKTEVGEKNEESPKSSSENIDAEKTADLPHVPLLQHKDLSLSEKAAVAVAGLVGPGTPNSVFDFRATTIDGKEMHLSEFSNNVLLIVNVASHCGYTDINYKGLQTLYERYNKDGLEILAFPSNEFGSQEPGSNAEIKQFVTEKYQAKFPLFSKVEVNGKGAHPLFAFLKAQFGIKTIPWNFQKFLVDRAGQAVSQWAPQMDPLAVEAEVAALLQRKDGGT